MRDHELLTYSASRIPTSQVLETDRVRELSPWLRLEPSQEGCRLRIEIFHTAPRRVTVPAEVLRLLGDGGLIRNFVS